MNKTTPQPKTVSIEALCELEKECGELELKLATERARTIQRVELLRAALIWIAGHGCEGEHEDSNCAEAGQSLFSSCFPCKAAHHLKIDDKHHTTTPPPILAELVQAEARLADACFHLKGAGRLLLTAATDEDGADGDESMEQHRNIEAFLSSPTAPIAFRKLEQAEARLAEAIGFIRELVDECAYGDNCPTFGSKHGKCLNCKAREFLSSTNPPPILAELERLRAELAKALKHGDKLREHCDERFLQFKSAEQERDALRAQLQVAKGELNWIKEYWKGANVSALDAVKVLTFRATEALAQLGGEKCEHTQNVTCEHCGKFASMCELNAANARIAELTKQLDRERDIKGERIMAAADKLTKLNEPIWDDRNQDWH